MATILIPKSTFQSVSLDEYLEAGKQLTTLMMRMETMAPKKVRKPKLREKLVRKGMPKKLAERIANRPPKKK